MWHKDKLWSNTSCLNTGVTRWKSLTCFMQKDQTRWSNGPWWLKNLWNCQMTSARPRGEWLRATELYISTGNNYTITMFSSIRINTAENNNPWVLGLLYYFWLWYSISGGIVLNKQVYWLIVNIKILLNPLHDGLKPFQLYSKNTCPP